MKRIVLWITMGAAGCGSLAGSDDNTISYPASDLGIARYPDSSAPYGSDLGSGQGSFGNVGVGGGQDFAAFRLALDNGLIPGKDSLDATGFFAEHYTTLPAPDCGQTFCLHALLSVSPDLVRGGDWTLLQMGMNSPVDPATVQKPPLDIAVVLDRSGSMADENKIDYAKQGVKQLIEALGPTDTFTFISFSDSVTTNFGPAQVTDKAALEATVDGIVADGSTDLYDALDTAYKAVLGAGDETQQRRVIFLTDGVATAGDQNSADILNMSAGYNEQYAGLTTIGLGSDADLTLLRSLAERGGGNFYFVDQPSAVTEIFMQELAFFVAPIAYDVDLTLEELPTYQLKQVYGTSLWSATPTGGTIHVPSVFLVSRTSTSPGPTGMGGGRRGGGSAIIGELTPTAIALATIGPVDVAKVHLGYRLPGSTTRLTQDVSIGYDNTIGEYYDDSSIETNTIIMDFFIAFRDATNLAQTDRQAALTLLQNFQPKIMARLAGWTDEDLLDDLRILQEYINVLQKQLGLPLSPSPAPSPSPMPSPSPSPSPSPMP